MNTAKRLEILSVAFKRRGKVLVVASVPCANQDCYGRRSLTFACSIKRGVISVPGDLSTVCEECGVSFGATKLMRQDIHGRIVAEKRAREWKRRKVSLQRTASQTAT